ncbi:hypothetical protein [Alkalithermobacter paradoxus]|uniref:Uncharacterized protein n=1 Tax=Alkalithermobacter paradoxus TaxID=29349 RepID=A0A1V4I7V8_9FIRM|nr:hypothetical protein CLOTH_11570 [[Clostridium] thermoalcaliphilum]
MEFIFSKITRSRLMGSVGLIICWQDKNDTVYQYFLLDAEGLGIADYVSIKNPSKDILHREEERLMGGLGAERIYISEDEAVFLVNYFGNKNLRYEKELPGKIEEYKFMIDKKVKEIDMFSKICKDIETEVEFVNYIVMRFIARDREALEYFSLNKQISDMYITNANGTLLKNKVTKIAEKKYKCQSLFEDDDGYYKINIGVQVGDFKITSLMVGEKEAVDHFYVLKELRKKEYITIYRVNNGQDFKNNFYKDNPYLMKMEFESGVMFTEFKKNNDHVKNNTYIISDDIKSIYYITNEDQLIVANYCEDDKIYTDTTIKEKYSNYVEFEDEYGFEGSLIYEFAQDGYSNFYDFISE